MRDESESSSTLASVDTAITLPADPRSAKAARRFVSEALRGEDTEQWELAAALLVTELVTNAILHARTEIQVGLRLEPDGLRIAVTDGSPRMPARRSYSDDATTGRGLALVERLSTAWGVDEHDEGKTVWIKLGAIDWESLMDAELAGSDDVPDFETAEFESTAGDRAEGRSAGEASSSSQLSAATDRVSA